MTQEAFNSIALTYSNAHKAEKLWREIAEHYSEKKRYYHNLQHLENMLAELEMVKHQINDWETIIMALAYHDIIYKSTAKDNEEKSASLAKERLTELTFPKEKIANCVQIILATKGHNESNDNDTNILTDSDLSILGKPWSAYGEYLKNVRKEYSIYPDFLYNPGRKKVLQQFLAMPRIFKTESFYVHYEQNAKSNIEKEISLL